MAKKMKIIIEVDEDSSEFKELIHMVEEAQKQDPGITIAQYIANIVNGYLKNRVLNIYVAHVKRLALEDLYNKFGDIDEIR